MFALLRTNTGLTTNIKIMIDTNYKLSLDSIESDVNLSYDKFKNISFNKTNYYDELIPYFYKDLPSDTAFSIKYDDDVDTMSNDFASQYDELYQYGARNIIENKYYSEEYEYFAPLYIEGNKFPSNFIIFRVDGAGITDINSNTFKDEIVNKFKFIKLFDLSNSTPLGEWLSNNFIDNRYFPHTPLEMDFRNLEFCRWNGIDYESGGYTTKSLFIDDILDEEKEIFELEKFIFDSYKNNKVVFPNILNLSFLFDDTPSTSEEKRKWSINRYYGFYIESMDLVSTMSSYIPVPLNSDISIDSNNIISSVNGGYPFAEPWSDKKPFYIEYKGEYYKVVQVKETISNKPIKVSNNIRRRTNSQIRDLGFSSSKKQSSVTVIDINKLSNTRSSIESLGDITIIKYKIISDLSLTGLTFDDLNNNYGIIKDRFLVDIDNNDFEIDGYLDDDSKSADIWLIELDGIYHNLRKDNNSTIVFSDYSFDFGENNYFYKVGGKTTSVNMIVDFDNPPKKFSIFKLKLSDIKDFDNNIVDTEYSKYEYEKNDELTNTDESKMYVEDLNSKTYPIDLDDFIYKNNVVNIPVSSEYTANYETFKIDGGELSNIWRKNPIYCRFSYQNSLSANDVPYVLNNSLIFEDFNRTSNVYDLIPNRSERNLDYFYSINSSTSSYIHHTLHIEEINESNEIDSSFKFELDKYLNLGTYSYSATQSEIYTFDYFEYFFSKKSKFYNGSISKNTKKYSYFNIGDNSISNSTLFRGIKFEIYNVDSVNMDSNNNIDKINISSNNDYNNYKFSILLSDNDHSVVDNKLIESNSYLDWIIIDEWKMDKIYPIGSKVIFDDILYTNSTGGVLGPSNPTYNKNGNIIVSNPLNQGWTFDGDSIFWKPNTNKKYVFNSNEYYYLSKSLLSRGKIADFWNPNSVYIKGDFVLYKNEYYISLFDNNNYHPKQSSWICEKNIDKWQDGKIYYESDIVLDGFNYYLSTKNGNTTINNIDWLYIRVPNKKWSPIRVWDPSVSYTNITSDYIVHNNIVYKFKSNTLQPLQLNGLQIIGSTLKIEAGEEPGVSTKWVREYSLEADTDFKYSIFNNSIIELNDKYYKSLNRTSLSTLDNGIVIYVNKKWKNILVNINISDNTYNNISGFDRDDLYNELYKKLTAANFMSCINDISNKYGFSDYLSYVVIEEDGTFKKYNYLEDIINLPVLVKCEGPDSLDVKVNSLFKSGVDLPNSLNPINKLSGSKIDDIKKLNYYNGNSVASNIYANEFEPKVFENYHGSKNILKNTIYRFSGYYMPLFYDIELFKRDFNNLGNYLFDTKLSNFGIMKERKIRKVNRRGSILRLKDSLDEKSIYPMLDEFGYSIHNFFIFSSTWDSKYYLESVSYNKVDNSSIYNDDSYLPELNNIGIKN